jgi:hypothetical protein
MIWSSYRVAYKVIYLERGGKFTIACTRMLLDHLIVGNLLVHLVLGSLNIKGGHWLLTKSYVSSSGRGTTSYCPNLLSLNALNILSI